MRVWLGCRGLWTSESGTERRTVSSVYSYTLVVVGRITWVELGVQPYFTRGHQTV